MHDSRNESEPAWSGEDLADDPHAKADKASRVRRMFAAIAGSYDLNNRVHSMGRDQAWRRKAVAMCNVRSTDVVLDAACGTGDLSLAFAAERPRRVIGLDFTHEMSVLAERKSGRMAGAEASAMPRHGRTGRPRVSFADGDALRLPVADRRVDVVSIAFGIRNVADPAAAVREFYRVLRPGGRLCILEFSLPTNPVMRRLYDFYFHHVMPRTATLISGDRSGAYKYLPRSVNTFLGRPEMVEMMRRAGFTAITQTPMTFGIAVAYFGRRT